MLNIAALLAVALVWLLVNIKAGGWWLKALSMAGLLLFMGAGSLLTLQTVGIL